MSDTVHDDVLLCIDFLDYTKDRISRNNIVYQKPIYLYYSDASEHGIDRFLRTSGRVWHFELLVDCQLHVSLNILEFLAAVISLWIDIDAGDTPHTRI